MEYILSHLNVAALQTWDKTCQLAVFSRLLQIVGTSNMMKTGFVVVFIH